MLEGGRGHEGAGQGAGQGAEKISCEIKQALQELEVCMVLHIHLKK